tara:strand:+ start:136 stop:438 length:303 start_codon:yes stop_codon:yes gene_type:complete
MKKKTNDIITWTLWLLNIALLVSGFIIYDKLIFLPEITFCYSSSTEPLVVFFQNFCEIPILKRFVLILNTRLVVMIASYFIILLMVFLILKKIGWKDPDL